MSKTLTRADLTEAVYRNIGLSRNESADLVEDVLEEGKIDATKNFGINEHCALIDKMEAENCFSSKLTKKKMTNLADYFVTLPSEAAMKLWTIVGKEDQGSLDGNIVGLHKSVASDGTKVAEYITKILTGTDKKK